MTDVALLALGLETSQMKSGADQANRVLDGLSARFDAAGRRIEVLKNQLQGSGTAIRATGQHWQDFGNAARGAGTALQGLGGPIGIAANRVQELGQQLTSLMSTFGLVGGGLIALAATAAAAGVAFVGFSVKGAKAADELLDISEATGLTVDQVQRLGAAMQRSGENVSGVERAFAQFQRTVVEATSNKTGEAARNLQRLGVSATEAGRDMGTAFITTLASLKELRETTEGAAASNEVFGRGIGALVRGSSELQSILGKTRKELEETGIIANEIALGAAADLDSQINRLTQSFNTFTIQLNGLGGGAGNIFFSTLADALEDINGWLDKISKSPFWTLVLTLVANSPKMTTPGSTISTPTFGLPASPGVRGLSGGGGGGGGSASAKAARDELTASEIEGLRKLKATYEAYQVPLERLDATLEDSRDRLLFLSDSIGQLRPTTEAYAALLKQVNDEQAKLNALISRQVELLPQISSADKTRLIGLIPGEIPPSADDLGPIRETTLARGPGRTFFNEGQRQQVRDNVGFIFEDFVSSIIAGRQTVGEAFSSFALGIVDTFASQFARILQEHFLKPVVDGLAGFLTDALDSLFSGISGGGVGKFLGGLAGKIFGGLFAEGGTMGANSWGVVGERGPEIITTGSRPVTISPMGAMAGGGMTNYFSFNINTQGGQVSGRTQDQLAETVLRAVERANRNRGA